MLPSPLWRPSLCGLLIVLEIEPMGFLMSCITKLVLGPQRSVNFIVRKFWKGFGQKVLERLASSRIYGFVWGFSCREKLVWAALGLVGLGWAHRPSWAACVPPTMFFGVHRAPWGKQVWNTPPPGPPHNQKTTWNSYGLGVGCDVAMLHCLATRYPKTENPVGISWETASKYSQGKQK